MGFCVKGGFWARVALLFCLPQEFLAERIVPGSDFFYRNTPSDARDVILHVFVHGTAVEPRDLLSWSVLSRGDIRTSSAYKRHEKTGAWFPGFEVQGPGFSKADSGRQANYFIDQHWMPLLSYRFRIEMGLALFCLLNYAVGEVARKAPAARVKIICYPHSHGGEIVLSCAWAASISRLISEGNSPAVLEDVWRQLFPRLWRRYCNVGYLWKLISHFSSDLS